MSSQKNKEILQELINMKNNGEISNNAFEKLVTLHGYIRKSGLNNNMESSKMKSSDNKKELDINVEKETVSIVDDINNSKNTNINIMNIAKEEKINIAESIEKYDKKINIQKSNPKNISVDLDSKNKNNKERNLSILLSLGVFLILLSGVIFSTTTWNLISNITKVILLFAVSLLFLSISIFSEKMLKIQKTSFAFWVLGILFLPIIFVAIAYFELFGYYLGIHGEGNNIFGMISTLICMPLFVYSTIKYKNKYFTFISLISTAVLFNFMINILKLEPNIKLSLWSAYVLLVTLIYSKIDKEKYYMIFNSFKYYSIVISVFNIIYIYISVLSLNLLFTEKYDGQLYVNSIFLILSLIIASIYSMYLLNRFKIISGILVLTNFRFILSLLCMSSGLNTNDFWYYFIIVVPLIIIFVGTYIYNKDSKLNIGIISADIFYIYVLIITSLFSSKLLYTTMLVYIAVIMLVIIGSKIDNLIARNILICNNILNIFIANLLIFIDFDLMEDIFANKSFHVSYLILLLNIAIIYVSGICAKNRSKKLYYICGYTGHALLIFLYLISLFFKVDRIIYTLVILLVCGISLYLNKNTIMKKIYLYSICVTIGVLFISIESLFDFNIIIRISIYFIGYLILILLGCYAYYNGKENAFRRNAYCLNLIGIILLVFDNILALNKDVSNIYSIILIIFLAVALYYNRIFIESKKGKEILLVSSIIMLYIDILINIEFFGIYKVYFLLVPTVIVFQYFIERYTKEYAKIFRIIGCIWYGIVSLALIINQISPGYSKSILLGVLLFLSIVIGFKMQNKMYFIGGIISLMIELIVDTRQLWTNIPWWIYLLLSGTFLIILATKTELKNKLDSDKRKFAIKNVKKYFNGWK